MDESQSQPPNTDSANARAPTPPARRRRWLQFSVRSLLLVILLCAAGVYAGRACFEPYRRQRQTMALIEKLGGRYETTEATGWLRRLFAGQSQDVILVDLADCDDPSAYLDKIAALPALETLVVGGRSFSDEDLSRLQRLKTLQGLVLDSTSVTDEGLATFNAALPHAEVYRSQRRAIASLRKMADVIVEPNPSHARLQALVGGVYFGVARQIEYWQRGDADLADIKGLDTVLILGLDRTGVCDGPLAYVKNLKDLHTLDLIGTGISDVGLAHVANLAQLDTLYLGGTNVSDGGLAQLSRLSNLRQLMLSNTKVTDAGLRHVKGMTSLRSLWLNETEVGDAGLAHLHGNNLAVLDLEQTKVTDAGLAHLRRMSNLRLLLLSHTQVGDAGLTHLLGLKNLEHLALYDTRITDLALAQLAGMSSLRRLYVGKTKVTTAGIEQLKRALPNCTVRADE